MNFRESSKLEQINLIPRIRKGLIWFGDFMLLPEKLYRSIYKHNISITKAGYIIYKVGWYILVH